MVEHWQGLLSATYPQLVEGGAGALEGAEVETLAREGAAYSAAFDAAGVEVDYAHRVHPERAQLRVSWGEELLYEEQLERTEDADTVTFSGHIPADAFARAAQAAERESGPRGGQLDVALICTDNYGRQFTVEKGQLCLLPDGRLEKAESAGQN